MNNKVTCAKSNQSKSNQSLANVVTVYDMFTSAVNRSHKVVKLNFSNANMKYTGTPSFSVNIRNDKYYTVFMSVDNYNTVAPLLNDANTVPITTTKSHTPYNGMSNVAINHNDTTKKQLRSIMVLISDTATLKKCIDTLFDIEPHKSTKKSTKTTTTALAAVPVTEK